MVEKSLPERVREFLESLGGTADEVAGTLEAMGVTGYVAMAAACPVTNAVKGRFGDEMEDCTVYDRVSYWYDRRGGFADEPVPEGCWQFVQEFDAQKFPRLICAGGPWELSLGKKGRAYEDVG